MHKVNDKKIPREQKAELAIHYYHRRPSEQEVSFKLFQEGEISKTTQSLVDALLAVRVNHRTVTEPLEDKL